MIFSCSAYGGFDTDELKFVETVGFKPCISSLYSVRTVDELIDNSECMRFNDGFSMYIAFADSLKTMNVAFVLPDGTEMFVGNMYAVFRIEGWSLNCLIKYLDDEYHRRVLCKDVNSLLKTGGAYCRYEKLYYYGMINTMHNVETVDLTVIGKFYIFFLNNLSVLLDSEFNLEAIGFTEWSEAGNVILKAVLWSASVAITKLVFMKKIVNALGDMEVF